MMVWGDYEGEVHLDCELCNKTIFSSNGGCDLNELIQHENVHLDKCPASIQIFTINTIEEWIKQELQVMFLQRIGEILNAGTDAASKESDREPRQP